MKRNNRNFWSFILKYIFNDRKRIGSFYKNCALFNYSRNDVCFCNFSICLILSIYPIQVQAQAQNNDYYEYVMPVDGITTLNCGESWKKLKYMLKKEETIYDSHMIERLKVYDRSVAAKVKIVSEEGSMNYALNSKIKPARFLKAVVLDDIKLGDIEQGDELILYEQDPYEARPECVSDSIHLKIGDEGYIYGYFVVIKMARKGMFKMVYEDIEVINLSRQGMPLF